MKETRAEYLPISKLHPFEGHPFKVVDNEEMDQLTWSILAQGLLTPLVVRPLDNGEYEVISGHRRLHACKKAGIQTVPALIYAIDRDAAAIALVDSNLHRESILPSEKAFAYKMKLEAMNRRGQRTDLTSSQLATKLDTAAEIGKQQGESRDKVYRYIRLTNLIPEILTKVDSGEIAISPAVEISYLTETEQYTLWDAMEQNDCTPSHAQTISQPEKTAQPDFKALPSNFSFLTISFALLPKIPVNTIFSPIITIIAGTRSFQSIEKLRIGFPFCRFAAIQNIVGFGKVPSWHFAADGW